MSTARRTQVEQGGDAEPVWQHLSQLMNNVATVLDWFYRKGSMIEPDPPISLREVSEGQDTKKVEVVSRVFPSVVDVLMYNDYDADVYLYDVKIKHIEEAEVFVVASERGCSVAVGGGSTYEYPPTSISSILFFLMNPEVELFACEVLSNAEVPERLRVKMATWREVRDAVLGLGRDAEDVLRKIANKGRTPYLDVALELWGEDRRAELTVGVEVVSYGELKINVAERFYVLVPVGGGKDVKLFCDLDGDAVNLLVSRVADRRQVKTLTEVMKVFADSLLKTVSATAALMSFDSSYLSVEPEEDY